MYLKFIIILRINQHKSFTLVQIDCACGQLTLIKRSSMKPRSMKETGCGDIGTVVVFVHSQQPSPVASRLTCHRSISKLVPGAMAPEQSEPGRR